MTRVLIIEDEIVIARFIEQQLNNHFDCEVEIAISYKEVLATALNFRPHLLICDINLQEKKTGLQIVAELQTKLIFETVFISSYQSLDIIKEATNMNPASYIVKPVNELRLFAGIQLAFQKVKENKSAGLAKDIRSELFNETEEKIIELIAQRMTTREIALALHLSPFTIKNYRHSICNKLNLDEKNNSLLRWALTEKGNYSSS